MRVSGKPISIPAEISWNNKAGVLNFKNAKEELSYTIPAEVNLMQEGEQIWFVPNSESVKAKALAGTTRANINNLVIGLTKGFEKKLELKGVGYRAKMEGKTLVLTLGKSHLDRYNAPAGVTITTPSQTEILVSGSRKDVVGQVSAEIVAFRKPEPYKGKGIRYAGQKIILKEVKK